MQSSQTAKSSPRLQGDIPLGNWIDKILPAAWRPYARLMRLDRPIGTWLLLFPCWWSLALASEGWPDPILIALFGLGAIIMRGAGCTINDMADRDFDAKVERTRGRPLASGAIGMKRAAGFLALQLAAGLAILLQFNPFAIVLGAASLLLVAPYPYMKRITWWPQAWLGITFNWGALLGWAAVRGDIGLPALLLYAAGLFWTLGYDTIYAHQDKEDDALIGVKSTARRLGGRSRPAILAFYSIAAAIIAAAGWTADLAWPFYFLLAAGFGQLLWQGITVDFDDSADCLAKFKSNRLFGWLLFGGVVLGQIA